MDYLATIFGPAEGQKHGYPGHPEIELALFRLYNLTKQQSHLELAQFFIEERGNPTGNGGRHYYDVEADERGLRENEMPHYYPTRRSYWFVSRPSLCFPIF